MSVYPQLLLSAGGGIVSAQQQAKQVANTATILIGLGGTGIDCLRTIKTQVYSRLEPDDPKAIIPTYQHIRFLGIDSDNSKQGTADEDEQEQGQKRRQGSMSLDAGEFFPIANPNVKAAFGNPAAIKIRRELDWLRWEDIPAGSLTDKGAGGIRQVGRFMLMDKATEFMSKLSDEIEIAKRDLQAPNVMIHIFSGLSGGTGSGTFLDVCYMVRHLAAAVGGVTVFGYFFLPDVNLSRIPSSQTLVRQYIPKNGYAAMQELDYCMQLQFNGGAFVQEYKDSKRIQWREQPVDMCHLICATDHHNNVIANAYDYAMNVTAEYVMDFLTFCEDDAFQLTSHLSNFNSFVQQGDSKKKIGSNVSYCIIGASCASIPLREINTYLAAELFDKFSRISRNTPTEQDVLKLATDAFSPGGDSLGQVYDAIYQSLRANADEDFPVYPNDYKFVLEYGDKELVDHYAGLLAKKRGAMESNATSLTDAENAQSLLRSIQTKLLEILRDVTRGPIYGYRMLAASESHNLLNLIDGLIRQNDSLLGQANYNRDDIRQNYEQARSTFLSSGSGPFSGAKKKYDTYLSCVTAEVQIQLTIDVYKTLDQVLRTFREQVVKATGEYYIKLSRVTSNLIDTFAENRNALAGGLGESRQSAFSIPMMTIEELKPALDAQIKGLDIPNMMSAFMDKLINNSDAWITGNEYKIARLVTDFFVKEAFQEFANLTITAFLREKYHTTTDEELKNKVYAEWIQPLTAKAAPLFYFNTAIWDSSKTEQVCSISVPQTSQPIVDAADKKNQDQPRWKVKKSALTDRIFVMGSSCVLPLSSYNNCVEYEQSYFSTTAMEGTHYYEGKPIDGMLFSDWRKLPSLTPASIVNMDTMPQEIRERTQAALALYEKAAGYGMFDAENVILLPKQESIDAVRQAIANWETAKSSYTKPEDLAKVQQAQKELTAAKAIQLERSAHKMRNDGYAQEQSDKLRVQRDHFVEAPAYQMIVSDAIKVLDDVNAAAEKTLAEMQALENKLGTGAKGMTEYFGALFSGVISVEGMVIVYHQSEFGVTTDHVLSKHDAAFPFAAIPFYQGYLSYQTLAPEIQSGIQDAVNDRLNALAPEMKTSCESLKTLLADARVNGMAQQAANFAERADIVAFLKKLKQEFTLFCQSNGI